MDEKTRLRELDKQMGHRASPPARAEGAAPEAPAEGAAPEAPAEGAGAARRRELRAGGLLVYADPARAQRVPCFTDLTVTDGRGRFAALSYCWDAGYGQEWSEEQFGDVEGLFGSAGAEELAEALETWDEWMGRAQSNLGGLLGGEDLARAAWDSWGPVRAPGWEGLCAQAAMAIPEAVAGRSGDVARTALPCAVASMALDWLGALAENVVPGEDGAPALEGLAARDLADAAVVRAMADIDWNNEGFQENALADLAGLQGDLDRAAGPAEAPAAPAAPAAGGGDDESEDEEAHL